MEEQEHPVDDEDLFVIVSVTHVPTNTTVTTEASGPDAIEKATKQAEDDLLKQLEVIGG